MRVSSSLECFLLTCGASAIFGGNLGKLGYCHVLDSWLFYYCPGSMELSGTFSNWQDVGRSEDKVKFRERKKYFS